MWCFLDRKKNFSKLTFSEGLSGNLKIPYKKLKSTRIRSGPRPIDSEWHFTIGMVIRSWEKIFFPRVDFLRPTIVSKFFPSFVQGDYYGKISKFAFLDVSWPVDHENRVFEKNFFSKFKISKNIHPTNFEYHNFLFRSSSWVRTYTYCHTFR